VFALGIMPYITASIIMQILTVVIPKLEEWQNRARSGQRKITQWTRYLTIGHRAAAVHRPRLPVPQRRRRLRRRQGTHGSTCFPTSRRAGCCSSCSPHRRHRPAHVDGRAHHPARHRQRHVAADLRLGRVELPGAGAPDPGRGAARACAVAAAAAGAGILVAIVFVEQGQRRIPVQFAKRVVGRRMYGGQSTYIPLKVNQSGVIPIIFASSVLYLPLLLTQVLPAERLGRLGAALGRRQPVQPDSIVYIAVYGLLIIGFAYFYTAIAFDPVKQADTSASRAASSPASGPGPRPSATWPRS
jgi:preprotein translocase subunit SecY